MKEVETPKMTRALTLYSDLRTRIREKVDFVTSVNLFCSIYGYCGFSCLILISRWRNYEMASV